MITIPTTGDPDRAPNGGARPSDSLLLMAAAEMHRQGRLIQPESDAPAIPSGALPGETERFIERQLKETPKEQIERQRFEMEKQTPQQILEDRFPFKPGESRGKELKPRVVGKRGVL